MREPAPGLFSTVTDWPQASCSLMATSRATRSVGPPGVKPTMMRMGLLGNVLAALALADCPPVWASDAGEDNASIKPTNSAIARNGTNEFEITSGATVFDLANSA